VSGDVQVGPSDQDDVSRLRGVAGHSELAGHGDLGGHGELGGQPADQRRIVVVAHNLRSAHNVGSVMRTGEVFAVDTLHVTGFTPYPQHPGDERDPILAARQTRRLAKAAAGAERTMPWKRHDDVQELLDALRADGFTVVGLEIDPNAVGLGDYRPDTQVALVLGDEVRGISPELRAQCDVLLQIPMYGRKSSLNVSVAAGIALYALRTA